MRPNPEPVAPMRQQSADQRVNRTPRAMTLSRRLLIAAAWLLTPLWSAVAQQASATTPAQNAACQSPEYRHFDFWIGSWEVTNARGEVVGQNEITVVSNGCGLLERWAGRDGGTGVSINAFDAATGKWTQRWVGAGSLLMIEGGLQGADMVLEGTSPRTTRRGPVYDRITWSPLADGRVRQRWDTRPVSGDEWEPLFVGFYSRVPGGEAGRSRPHP